MRVINLEHGCWTLREGYILTVLRALTNVNVMLATYHWNYRNILLDLVLKIFIAHFACWQILQWQSELDSDKSQLRIGPKNWVNTNIAAHMTFSGSSMTRLKSSISPLVMFQSSCHGRWLPQSSSSLTRRTAVAVKSHLLVYIHAICQLKLLLACWSAVSICQWALDFP
jgi:hypothetical protein